jgi:hypothetical protein
MLQASKVTSDPYAIAAAVLMAAPDPRSCQLSLWLSLWLLQAIEVTTGHRSYHLCRATIMDQS